MTTNKAMVVIAPIALVLAAGAALAPSRLHGQTRSADNLACRAGRDPTPPPAGFTPLRATAQELRRYGFPPRPTDPEALGEWNRIMSHALHYVAPIVHTVPGVHYGRLITFHKGRLPAVFIPVRAVTTSHSGSAQPRCPKHTVCDRTLGIALNLPIPWHLVPAGKFPAHTLAWFSGPPRGLGYNIRLVIGPAGTTRFLDNQRAARVAAYQLIHGYRGVRVTQQTVRYGGGYGILVRGLPGNPPPSAIIILAHAGVIYRIVAPGSTLAPDQRHGLESLRFIGRSGRFPPAQGPTPIGSVAPRPIPLSEIQTEPRLRSRRRMN